MICRNESNRLAKGVHTGDRAGGAARKKVTIQTHGKDKYGRMIADMLLPEGSNVNYTLVKEGWCWWYRKYAPRNTELARLEQNARETKKGLWMGPTHIPPWQWRKRTR
jgi:endonuclease YncB( thermonuclease family)